MASGSKKKFRVKKAQPFPQQTELFLQEMQLFRKAPMIQRPRMEQRVQQNQRLPTAAGMK